MSVLTEPSPVTIPTVPVVLPACESCEYRPATVTVRYRTEQFSVCTSCLPEDLYTLKPTKEPSHVHELT